LRTTVFHKVIKRHLPAVLAGFLFLFLFIGDLHAQYSQPPRRKKRDTFRINPYLFDSLAQPIPMGRVLFHDKIDKEQQKADDFDGKTDNVVKVPGDSTSTAIFTRSLIHDVDRLQIMVENFPANGRDAVMENQQKIQALRALWELMRIYNGDSRPDPVFYKKLVNNMHDMLVAINENKLMAFAKANPDIYTLNNGKVLFDKQPEVRAMFILSWERPIP
jgi:ribosomal protein L20